MPDQLLLVSSQVISVKDNDSLAARLASELNSELLVIMSDVNGLYTAPPGMPDSRLLHTYSPDRDSVIIAGKSRVGTGGMDSKVSSTCSVVGPAVCPLFLYFSLYVLDISI